MTYIHTTPPILSQPTLGQPIQTIIKDKTSTRKDKWGVQAINWMYLCQWQLPLGTTQQCRKEEELLNPDNILLEHNTLRITQYHNAQVRHKTTQTYDNFLHHK
jgi:hypothetical protein